MLGSNLSRRAMHTVAAVVTTGLCLAAGFGLHQAAIYQRNIGQLGELSRQLLIRADLAADYAIVSLTELFDAGVTTCSSTRLSQARQLILRRGSVKDIEVLNARGEVACAAIGEPVGLTISGKAQPSRNEAMTLQRAGVPGDGLLRLTWKQSENQSLAALLNVDSLMFDLFPPQLRETANATITIGDDDVVAGYRGGAIASGENVEVFHAVSSRFPFQVELRVARDEIAAWNAETLPFALLLSGAIGLVISYLIVVALGRPPDPVATLRKAMRAGEIQPYFQPIFSLADRRIVGCEVLARWIKPDGMVTAPDRFIPLAETSGLIFEMTDLLVARALSVMQSHLDSHRGFKITFNINARHFLSEGFIDHLVTAAEAHGVRRQQLIIELTERQSFDSDEAAIAVAARARALGFGVALDDTGSGHNGLSRLQDMPIDVIKIDKKFVDFVGKDRAATAIIQMLVRLAHEVGASTVAEGIETETQAKILAECGVLDGQGYLVSPALPHHLFEALVSGPSKSSATFTETAAA